MEGIKKLYLWGLIAFGFILRLIAARNLGVSADDVNHAVRPIGIFGSGKLVIWDQSSSLWYYIQEVFYNIFGTTQIASRLAAVIFGTALIALMFIFVKKVLKSEKAAWIAAVLVACSPFLIKNTLPEMDVAAAFFMMFSALFIFKYLESGKNREIAFAGIMMGIAVLIKTYAVMLAASFLIFLLYHELKKEKDRKKIAKRIMIFAGILLVFAMPTLIHNALLYTDKGFMDLIFTNTFKLGTDKAAEIYKWNAGWMAFSDYKGFFLGNQRNFDPTAFPGMFLVFEFLLKGDLLITILGLLGMILLYKKNREYFWFFIICFVPLFIYLGATIPMSKHFVWALVLFVLPAGAFSEKIAEALGKRGIKMRYLLWAFIIFNLLYLGAGRGVVNSHFYSESAFGQMISYKNEHIQNNALVVADSRIYRGSIHWAFAGTNYVESSIFMDNFQAYYNGSMLPIDVYYFECVRDDCGWGTIKDQPDFNKSMEEFTAFIANNSQYSQTFYQAEDKYYYLPLMASKEPVYRVYKTRITLNPQILQDVKQTHTQFMYPIGYDRNISPIFDDYSTKGIRGILNGIGFAIMYSALALSFISIVLIFFMLFKPQNEAKQQETFNNNTSI